MVTGLYHCAIVNKKPLGNPNGFLRNAIMVTLVLVTDDSITWQTT